MNLADDPEVRCNATMGPALISELLSSLKDKNPNVRVEVVRALDPLNRSQRPDPRVQRVLRRAKKDPDKEVRRAAYQALDVGSSSGAAPEPESTAKDQMKALLESPDPRVRSRAAKDLIERHGPRAVEACLAALRDPNEEVRMAALMAAWSPYGRRKPLQDPRLVDPLVVKLKDSNRTFVLLAAIGLAAEHDACCDSAVDRSYSYAAGRRGQALVKLRTGEYPRPRRPPASARAAARQGPVGAHACDTWALTPQRPEGPGSSSPFGQGPGGRGARGSALGDEPSRRPSRRKVTPPGPSTMKNPECAVVAAWRSKRERWRCLLRRGSGDPTRPMLS